jgi:hypothetical protein
MHHGVIQSHMLCSNELNEMEVIWGAVAEGMRQEYMDWPLEQVVPAQSAHMMAGVVHLQLRQIWLSRNAAHRQGTCTTVRS